jgi:dTDP-D-glucose 4,6-dehydratase
MITAGVGFIGSHVIDILVARGCAAGVFDDLSSGRRENVGAGIALTVGDLRDNKTVGIAVSNGVDCVFHLAAQIDAPEETYARLITFVSDRPGDDRRYALDSGKLHASLSWMAYAVGGKPLVQTVPWFLHQRQNGLG